MVFNLANQGNVYMNWYIFYVKNLYMFFFNIYLIWLLKLKFILFNQGSVNHLVLKDALLRNRKYLNDWIEWLNWLIYTTLQSIVVAE